MGLMVYRDFRDYILMANIKRIRQLKAFLMTPLKEKFIVLGDNTKFKPILVFEK